MHFSAIDIKNLKVLLQFSKDVCSLESLEGNTEKMMLTLRKIGECDGLEIIINEFNRAKSLQSIALSRIIYIVNQKHINSIITSRAFL